jgi:CrcB protein
MSAGMRDLLLVAAGGALGSAARYGVGRLMGPQMSGAVPWHTLFVNASGAFLIGLLLVAAARLGWPGWWRPFLAVGILGGYTTFSTFSLETVELILRGSYGTAAGYAAGTLLVGILACGGGILLGRNVL